MANDLCPNLDQFLPSRGQGPALNLSRQDQLSKEVPKVVGQDEEMESDLVVVEFGARQARPFHRILALLDPLLSGSPLVVEPGAIRDRYKKGGYKKGASVPRGCE